MSRFGFLGIMGAVLLATGCVSSSQHNDLMQKYLEEEALSRRLAAENAKLTAALQGRNVDVAGILKNLPPVDVMPPGGGGRPFKPVPGDATPLPDGGMRFGELNFRPGSAELSEKGKAALDQVAAQLKARPGFILVVDGHTDTDPIAKTKNVNASNWELSGKRAAAVLDHLVKAGVCDGKHAYLRGYGEFKPISPDKAKNRRVEIYAFDAPGLAGGSGAKATGPEEEPVAPAPPPTPTRPAPKPPVSKDPTLK
jgi:outer membrane protein OmpA-like peptidoglycan-associated protein